MANKNSPARIRANHKYDAKTYEKLAFRLKKGEKALLVEYAESQNLSISGLINKLIRENIPAFANADADTDTNAQGDDFKE